MKKTGQTKQFTIVLRSMTKKHEIQARAIEELFAYEFFDLAEFMPLDLFGLTGEDFEEVENQ